MILSCVQCHCMPNHSLNYHLGIADHPLLLHWQLQHFWKIFRRATRSLGHSQSGFLPIFIPFSISIFNQKLKESWKWAPMAHWLMFWVCLWELLSVHHCWEKGKVSLVWIHFYTSCSSTLIQWQFIVQCKCWALESTYQVAYWTKVTCNTGSVAKKNPLVHVTLLLLLPP